MRIDSGAHKGKKLVVPEGRDVRPTGDRARQAIFNMLVHGQDAIRGAAVLDAFAGSAALGLEALSRGAASLVAFDTDPAALSAIRANVAGCRAEARTTIRQADALRPPPAAGFGAAAPATLVFLDPPYGKDMVPAAMSALDKAGWIAPTAVVVVELDRGDPFDLATGYEIETDRIYGKARVLILRRNSAG